MKRPETPLRLAVSAALLVGLGCAHTRVEPFLGAPDGMTRSSGEPPACYTAPLEGCVGQDDDGSRRTIDSPWRERFRPDLYHRVCSGDEQARVRFRDGLRTVTGDVASDALARRYLDLVDGCTSPGFCEWGLDLAGDDSDPLPARRILLEGARRACTGVVPPSRMTAVASSLGIDLEELPPWRTSSRDQVCLGIDRDIDPWLDMAAQQTAGCLDLVEWLDRHRDQPDATAGALERCVDGHEIRYREAACLRELAGLDYERAVAWLQGRERRRWGLASDVTRYARTLLRFPDEHELERELTRLGLISNAPLPAKAAAGTAVLPEEILERHGRLLRFNPACPPRYCEHAPLAYQLTALVSPDLDGLIFDERWPAIEKANLGAGPRAVSSTVRGIPVTFHVAANDDGDGFDAAQLAGLRAALETATAAPHVLDIYDRGQVIHVPIHPHGEWIDLATLVGALNSILAEHRSPMRLTTLDPNCMPCARVVAGPTDSLIEAAFAGLIEPVDPYKNLWVEPTFETGCERATVRDLDLRDELP